jgi:hypothetical protein
VKDTARLMGVLAVAVGSLLCAGCGGGAGTAKTAGGASPGTVSKAPPTATTGQGSVPVPKGASGGGNLSYPVLNAQSKFALCLRQEGIPLSAVKRPGMSPRQQIAVRKCGTYLPGGVNGGVLPAVEKFRACMKKHGAPLPPVNPPIVFKTEDPKVAAAVKACKSLLPSAGGTT